MWKDLDSHIVLDMNMRAPSIFQRSVQGDRGWRQLLKSTSTSVALWFFRMRDVRRMGYIAELCLNSLNRCSPPVHHLPPEGRPASAPPAGWLVPALTYPMPLSLEEGSLTVELCPRQLNISGSYHLGSFHLVLYYISQWNTEKKNCFCCLTYFLWPWSHHVVRMNLSS